MFLSSAREGSSACPFLSPCSRKGREKGSACYINSRCVCVVEDHLGTYWKQIFVGHLVQVWDCSDAVTEKEYKDDVE